MSPTLMLISVQLYLSSVHKKMSMDRRIGGQVEYIVPRSSLWVGIQRSLPANLHTSDFKANCQNVQLFMYH